MQVNECVYRKDYTLQTKKVKYIFYEHINFHISQWTTKVFKHMTHWCGTLIAAHANGYAENLDMKE